MPLFNILDFGASDGADCTHALQSAFNAAAAQSGTVFIPCGTYHTGTIDMRGASLHLERGARLVGSPDINAYPPVGYDHNEMGTVRSLLYCKGGSGFSITGEGTIDLNGGAFFDFERRSIPESRVPFTKAQIDECTAHYDARPNQPMFFLDCKHITIKDVRIEDAPSWTMSFVNCDDVRVTDLTIENDMRIPNCDGMHFSCCRDVSVRGCHISAGDDCVAFTCITDWSIPCERATVSDCVFRSASKAISIGYMHSIVRDIAVSNCVVVESNRPLVIMSSPGSGLVEHICLSNLRLDSRIYAGNWWGNGEPFCLMGTFHDYARYRDQVPDRAFPVAIRDVLMSNISCSGENVIAIVGEDGSVRDVTVRGLSYERKPSANLALKGPTIDLAPGPQNAELPSVDGHWLYMRSTRNVRIESPVIAPYNGRQLEAFQQDVQ